MSEMNIDEIMLCTEQNAAFFENVIAIQAQAAFEQCWGYCREKCPDMKARFAQMIANYQSKCLISKADSFDGRSHEGDAKWRLAQKGDYIILINTQRKGATRVNHARYNGFSYTFRHFVIVAYYPATDRIETETYSTSS